MSLIDDVKALCDRLDTRGWRNLLLAVSGNKLDIRQPTAAKLKSALAAPLATIDRTRAGFEDFHPSGNQGISPGRPARSLLFHALASPRVHPNPNVRPNPDDYPTLAEIDTLENYVYSLSTARLVGPIEIAVFAYQYREGTRTSHRRHADFAFSRTGVARVGTAAPHYDPVRRSFWVLPPGPGEDGIAVLPARYGVFLARRGGAAMLGSVQGSAAPNEVFLFPFRKLFDGPECLPGRQIELKYLEYHLNEKLRRIHALPEADGGLPLPPGFDLDKYPYVRDSQNGGNLVSLQRVGGSVLVVPKPAASLVRTVSQHNSVANAEQIVHFLVPPSPRITQSTLMISAAGSDRLAPEYVNIRHQVDPAGPPDQVPVDLNGLPPALFDVWMAAGGFAAAHFTDDSADGCVEAVVQGLPATFGGGSPAFSLVTAPDFFPLADQIEVETDPSIIRVKPLSRGRLPVNPKLRRPSNNGSAFARNEFTLTAVVGSTASGPQLPIFGQTNRSISYLADAASDVFAPGWDVSRSRDAMGSFLSSLGLGSPFPEDAKLCAAIASFWPAVAPDNGRTFGNEQDADIFLGNQLPMIDEELGFHPDHERVKAGEIDSFRGWDGEYGPFFETVGTQLFVNYVAIERSDYVSQAMAGRIRVGLTARVQSEDLVARHQALAACSGIVPADPGEMPLVVFRRVADWASGRLLPQLAGGGFWLEFAETTGPRQATGDLLRVRRAVKTRHLCQVGTNGVVYRKGSGAPQFFPL